MSTVESKVLLRKHVVLLEKKLPNGRSKVCDYRCYGGDPAGECKCICGGKFHGIALGGAHEVTPEQLDEVRRSIPVAEGEHVVLRMFA